MPEETPELAKGKARALRLLAARPRTESQIRDRLARDGLAAVAPEVVAWLSRLGYLDDAAYARARARLLLGPGRLGPRLVERRLVAAGLPAEQAKEAVALFLAEYASESARDGKGPERALCKAAISHRLRAATLGSLDDKEKRRLARFLVGRGFSPHVAAQEVGIFDDFD